MILNLSSLRLGPILVLAASAGVPLHAQDGRSLDGIAHVALRVGDVAKSREFYRTLGWEQAFEFGDDKGTATSYVKVSDRQFIELYRRGAPTEATGLMHICFDASDIQGVVAAYRSAGLTVRDPSKARAGNLLFAIRDPEGHTLEYTQYMPGSLHMNEKGKRVLETRLSDHMIRVSQPVSDVTAEAAYFTGKLGFTDLGSGLLRTPGASGEQVQLDAGADAKPRLLFEVAAVKRVADELKKRGVAVESSGAAATVHDPDGTIVVFSAR